MDYEEQILLEAKKAIEQYPDKRSEIVDLYQMASEAIEDGESAAHEYELFMGSLGEL